MKRFLTIVLCIVCLSCSTVYSKEIEEPKNLYAQAAVLMDADSGRILFAKNADKVMPMASTTKIMTCILTLELGNPDDIVNVSENATSQPKVHLGMQKGEQFYLKDLLYSLMLESHNDSAVAIAEHIGGSLEGFANLMNQKAKEIGCTNTYYITPNGLDAIDENGLHSTTASDLATVMSYCVLKSIKKDDFRKITQTMSYSFTNVSGNKSFSCSNHNSFLTMMDGAISGKTGFTGKAGYCYVGALERDGRTFVVALLACGWPNNKNYKWKDTMKLMEYAVENYEYQNIYEELDLPQIEVINGIPDDGDIYKKVYTSLKTSQDSTDKLQVLLRSDEKIEIETQIPYSLVAPITEGQEVGKVVYYLNGENIAENTIVVVKSVKKKNMTWYFENILHRYLCMN